MWRGIIDRLGRAWRQRAQEREDAPAPAPVSYRTPPPDEPEQLFMELRAHMVGLERTVRSLRRALGERAIPEPQIVYGRDLLAVVAALEAASRGDFSTYNGQEWAWMAAVVRAVALESTAELRVVEAPTDAPIAAAGSDATRS